MNTKGQKTVKMSIYLSYFIQKIACTILNYLFNRKLLINNSCIFHLTLFHNTLMLCISLTSVTLKSSIFGAKI